MRSRESFLKGKVIKRYFLGQIWLNQKIEIFELYFNIIINM
jgi:hypothetical protein